MRFLIGIMHFYNCSQHLIPLWLMLYMGITRVQVLKYVSNKTFQQFDWAPLPFDKVCFRTKAYSCAVCAQFVQLQSTTRGDATHQDHEGNGIPAGSNSRPCTHVPDTRFRPTRAGSLHFKTRYPKARKVKFGGEDNPINPESLGILQRD